MSAALAAAPARDRLAIWCGWVLVAVGLAAVGVRWRRARRRGDSTDFVVAASWFLIPSVVLIATSPVMAAFTARYLAFCAPAVALLRQAGLLNVNGYDAFYQRIVFPLRQGEHIINIYGRSIGTAFAHRFLPGTKGGLYAWEKVQHCPEVILVEGLLDYTVLRQAGFHNVTCSLGTHLNADQFRQLCEQPRTVYLAFDIDQNQSGQQAAEQLSRRLGAQGIAARRVLLPEGQDPNSFFVEGGDTRQFQSLLEAALP